MKKLLIMAMLVMLVFVPLFAEETTKSLTMGYSLMTSSGYTYPAAEVKGNITSITITVDKGSFTVGSDYTPSYQDLTGLSKTFDVESASEAQSILRSAVFSLNANKETQSISVTVSDGVTNFDAAVNRGSTSITVTQYNINGEPHYYSYVTLANENDYNMTNSISFADAYKLAKQLTFKGMKGYLATITSSDENSVLDNITLWKGWGGGGRVSQANAALNKDTFTDNNGNTIGPASGYSWYWVCGPEAGKQFNAPNSTVSSDSSTAYKYSFWASGEPNGGNGTSGEYLLMLHHEKEYKWNDINNSAHQLPGLFVEWSNPDASTYVSKNVSNAEHVHEWKYVADGSKLKAYCDCAEDETSRCEYAGLDNAVSVRLVTGHYRVLTSDKDVTWSSSNTAVAKVNSETGLVKSVAPGVATITATDKEGSGVTAKCQITVEDTSN